MKRLCLFLLLFLIGCDDCKRQNLTDLRRVEAHEDCKLLAQCLDSDFKVQRYDWGRPHDGAVSFECIINGETFMAKSAFFFLKGCQALKKMQLCKPKTEKQKIKKEAQNMCPRCEVKSLLRVLPHR